jgi:hypothetical protein
VATPILSSNRESSPDEPRLAVCMVCNKIERMPATPAEIRRVPAKVELISGETHTFKDPQGSTMMVPEFDPVLEDFVGRHEHGLDDVSGMQAIKVFPVDPDTWEKMDVVTELKKELQQVTGEFFEESKYYLEEAIKCYNEHHNPVDSCPDYLSDAKKIGPKVSPKYQIFLCHLCPYTHSFVNVELRKKKGWYNPKNSKKLTIARDNSLSAVRKIT